MSNFALRKTHRGKPVLPTPADMAILRRAARGFVMVTIIDGAPRYSYEDGTPVSLREKNDSGARHFKKLVAEGWLVPEEGDALFEGGPPQRYRARSL